MAFFRNILSNNKRVDTDMEAGGHSDIELDNIEAGGSAHPLPDIELADIEAGSGSAHPLNFAFSYSSPAPNNVPNPAFPSFPPAEILKTDGKRSQNNDGARKVQVVEQGSNIPVRVCLQFL